MFLVFPAVFARIFVTDNNKEDTLEGLCVIKAMNDRFEMSEFF